MKQFKDSFIAKVSIVPIWFYSYLCLLFLSLIIGDTFFFIPISGLVCFFALLILLKDANKWSNILREKHVTISLVLFLTFQLLATLKTHSFPLSIQELTIHSTFFILFSSVALSREKITNKAFSLGMIYVSLILILLSLLVNLIPILQRSLQPMNLLYSSFGHNHLAGFLVLVLPIAVFNFYRSKSKISFFYLALIVISLILTNGRVAIFVGLLQIAGFIFVSKRKKSYLISLLLLLFFGLFAVMSSKLNVLTDSRIHYWQQALYAVFDYPIFGYGPGTFTLINKKYQIDQTADAAFAHNQFLEIFAESGALALVAYLSLFYFAGRQLLEQWKRGSLFHLTLFFSLFGQIVNNFFDYDLNHIGISLSMAMILAIGIKNTRYVAVEKSKSSFFLLPFLKMSLSVSFFVVFLVGFFYLLTIAQTTLGDKNSGVDYRKYLIFEKSKLLDLSIHDSNIKRALLSVYSNDFEVYEFLLSHEQNNEQKIEYYDKLEVVAPWVLFSHFSAEPFILTNKIAQLDESLERMSRFLEINNTAKNSEISRRMLARQYIYIASKFYDQQQFKTGTKYVLKGVSLRSWTLGEDATLLYYQHIPPTEWCNLMGHLSGVPEWSFGTRVKTYVPMILFCYRQCFSMSCSINQKDFTQNLLQMPSLHSNEIFYVLYEEEIPKILSFLRAEKKQDALLHFNSFSELVSLLLKHELSISAERLLIMQTITQQLEEE